MNLEKDTRRMLLDMHPELNIAALCAATGVKQRWYYKFKNREGTHYWVDSVQALHDYLVRLKRKKAA